MTYEIVYEPITDNLNKDYTINMNERCIVDNNNNVQKFLTHGESITLISNDNTSSTIKIEDLHINYKYAKLKRSSNIEVYLTKNSLDEYILNEYNIDVREDMDYDTFIILSGELLERIQNKSIKLNKYTEDDVVSIEFILTNNNKFFVLINNYVRYDGYKYFTYLPRDVLVSTISNTVVCKYINTNVTELVIKHQNKV